MVKYIRLANGLFAIDHMEIRKMKIDECDNIDEECRSRLPWKLEVVTPQGYTALIGSFIKNEHAQDCLERIAEQLKDGLTVVYKQKPYDDK